MTEKSKHIIYSKADIEKYLQGKMSYEEMHQLELAALQDLFLADAIEGYTNADQAITAQHLSEIETEILANRPVAKVVNINKKKSWGFMQVAASIVVIVIGTYAASLLFKKNIPTTTEKEIAVTEPNKTIANTDTITNNNIASVTENKATQKTEQSNGNANAATPFISTERNDDIRNVNNNVMDSAQNYDRQLAQADTKTYQWKPEDEKTKEAIAKDNTNIKVDTIANGNLAANTNAVYYNYNGYATANDASKFNTKARKGYSTENAASNTINLAPIKMKADTSYKPVAVSNVGFKAKKELSTLPYKLTKEDSLAVPVNGWASFNEYVRNNTSTVSYTDTSRNNFTVTNGRTGEAVVDLEFLVDKDGKPDKIVVTNSTNAANDTTAINLLKNGPRWITTDNENSQRNRKNYKKKAKVSIKF